MVCSVPSGKGGSNWLDRLRSNKGFPIPDNVLDLSEQNKEGDSTPPNSPSPNSPSPSPSPSPSQNPNKASFAVITGILSDLFYITPPHSHSRKIKFPRKQSSPKIFSLIPNQPLTLSSSSTSHDDDKQLLLSGFSKTEVTVIDTSSHLWKSDKLIFRRNHVWKIKDYKNRPPKYFRNKFSPSQHHRFHSNAHRQIPPNQSLKPFNQEYNAEHCSGPEMSANAPDSSNDKKESPYTLLQENGSYDPEKSDQLRGLNRRSILLKVHEKADQSSGNLGHAIDGMAA